MSDTIAAIATGSGVSAIGIVRISGCDAILAADTIFRAKSGVKMSQSEDRKLIYGELINSDGIVFDLCLCTVSRGPNSYTGEDTAEFHCHGSPVVLSEALYALFKTGVRQALAGEFTKRAFLNGQLDLSQAEAVIDLIESETGAAAVNAVGQLKGAVGAKIDQIYGTLLDISAHFFAVIDYPDEDIDAFDMQNYNAVLSDAEKTLSELRSTFQRGQVMKDGVKTAIIGKPNVGKSSLLNALLGYERAIVTPIAGTTRDTIEEKIRIKNVLLRLVDTAGIRQADDAVEKLGIERAFDAAKSAQLILVVFDGHADLQDDDLALMKFASQLPNTIAVINKSDLKVKIDLQTIEQKLGKVVTLSSLTYDGIDLLANKIEKMFNDGIVKPAGEILTNARQADAIERSLDSIHQAKASLSAGVTPDAVLTEVEAALSALGEITGKTVREDMTKRIFERFCVGK